MNVLRKEKPSNTEEVARDLEERRRNFSRPEIVADPDDRRPPQSVTLAAVNPAVTTANPAATTANPAATETALPERSASTVPASQPPGAGQAEANVASSSSREPGGQSHPMDGHTPLFDEPALREFRSRWDQVQTSFVDEPNRAVDQADALVVTVIQRISDQFSQERSRLEEQSASGHDASSTEDLRQRFQRYHAFFDRLLAF